MVISLVKDFSCYSSWTDNSVTFRTTLVSSDDFLELFSTPAIISNSAGDSLNIKSDIGFMYVHASPRKSTKQITLHIQLFYIKTLF
jgi:hypothetical protein